MKKHIAPTKEQVEIWVDQFVPSIDLFFIEEKHLEVFKQYIKDVLVMPLQEFLNHASYKQIQFVNSYMYWTLPKKVAYVIVANAEWLADLPTNIRKYLLELQHEMTPGLTIPYSFVSSRSIISNEYIVHKNNQSHPFFQGVMVENEDKFLIIRSSMWQRLSKGIKEDIVTSYAKIIEDWTCFPIPENTPPHIKRVANQFTTIAGSNCLAATLFAISQEEWILTQWVHPQTFLTGLANQDYQPVEEEAQADDVVVWLDRDGNVQHATYYIGEDCYFNKSGQSFFEPWKITSFHQIQEIWREYTYQVYRKNGG